MHYAIVDIFLITRGVNSWSQLFMKDCKYRCADYCIIDLSSIQMNFAGNTRDLKHRVTRFQKNSREKNKVQSRDRIMEMCSGNTQFFRLIIGILFHDRAFVRLREFSRCSQVVSLFHSATQVVVYMITPIIVSTPDAFVVSFIRIRNPICGFKPTQLPEHRERPLTERWRIYQCNVRTIIASYLWVLLMFA